MQKRKQREKPSARARYLAPVKSASQFDALSSPIRDQIVQVVVNQAPWAPGAGDEKGVSIREIAEQLGRKPASLYRHIEALIEVGLIREIGPRASGGRDATTYGAIGEAMHLVTPERQGPAMDALCRYIERMGAHAGSESAAAARERAIGVGPNAESDQGTVSMFGWLDADQRARLRELLLEVAAVFERAERRPGTRLVAASMLVRPVRLPDGQTAEHE